MPRVDSGAMFIHSLRMDQTQCNFVLFNEATVDGSNLETEICKNKKCRVETVTNAKDLLAKVSLDGVACAVCNVKVFDLEITTLASQVHGLNKYTVVIVAADKTDKKAEEYLHRMDRIVVLDKPFAPNSVALLCDKVVQGQQIRYRRFKRFPTNQIVKIERLGSDSALEGKVYNMSKGGAYIEIEKGAINAKDILKLTIQLDKISKAHIVHGRVMWTIPHGFNTKNFGAGIEFMNSDEAYMSLLEKG